MTFDQIYKDLQAGKFKPIYLLMGDEPYYIDKVSNFIENNVLSESEKDFNMTVLYGKDTTARTVDMAAKRFPMMAQYQIVVVKEAQNLKKIDDLVHYALSPSETTILVLAYKYKVVAKNKKLYKAINKTGAVLESKKLYDRQIPGWINNYIKEKNLKISAVASALLSEYLGADLAKVANEIDKLALNLHAGTEITPQIIQDNIGISKDYNVFELQKAIIEKNILKANRIINYFGDNQKEHPIFNTISFLYSIFSKIMIFHFTKDKSDSNLAREMGVSPYFLKDYRSAAAKYNPRKTVQIISYLRDYDLKAKGVNNVSLKPADLLQELIFKILH